MGEGAPSADDPGKFILTLETEVCRSLSSMQKSG